MKTEPTEVTDRCPISRRRFIGQAVAVAAAFMGGTQTLTAATKAASVKISPYSYLALTRQLGTSFKLRTPRGRFKLILADVAEDRCDAILQQYTARFVIKGKPGRELGQEVYELQHRKLGNLSLLLSPVSGDQNHALLATFSHLKS